MMENFAPYMTVIVPALALLAGWAVRQFTNVLADQIDNETADRVLSEIGQVVPDSVLYAGQVYVDSLKEAGAFDEAAQREALRMAIKACMSRLSKKALEFIKENFGDPEEYLTGRIEAEVKRQKQGA